MPPEGHVTREYARRNKNIGKDELRKYASNPRIEIVYDIRVARRLLKMNISCLVWRGKCNGSCIYVFEHAKVLNIYW